MKLSELYPSSILKAQDVTDAGGEMPLTIKDIQVKEFDGDNGKERKPVIYFVEDKQMVCNKTNGNIIAKMFGDDTDGWIGKQITLVVKDVDFAGKSTPAIRVKNLDSKEDAITSFWTKARAIGLTREEGLAHLKEYNNDFKAALLAIEANPF